MITVYDKTLLLGRPDGVLHGAHCDCDECVDRERKRSQHLTPDPPLRTLPDGSVSLVEIVERPRYQVLEDWSDD